MSKRRRLPDPDRRKFLKGATLAGAAAVDAGSGAAQGSAPAAAAGGHQSRRAGADPDRTGNLAARPGSGHADHSGGDFMVDVLKTLDIDYLAMNCASSFRGLHEAVINYGGNNKPEILTCPHEEIAVAHGPRLRQDRRQADGDDLPRRGRPAARHHGDVQRLVRPRAGHRDGRQHHRGQQARAGRRMGAFRASISARSCAISPSGTTSRRRCSISPSWRCAPTRSPPRRRWGR